MFIEIYIKTVQSKGQNHSSIILFLWHLSVDSIRKSLFPKFQLIQMLRYMLDYVYYIAPYALAIFVEILEDII